MILLMGLPGSGKGTQGKMMADQHGMHLITMGEIIRLYVSGARRTQMLAGELLEDAEVINLLDKVFNSLPDKEKCVLDGFPRTFAQAEWLIEKARNDNFSISYVINLEAGEDVVRRRLQSRGRIDDKEEVMAERFREYEELTLPLVDWYKEHNIKVININAERSVYEVNDDVTRELHL